MKNTINNQKANEINFPTNGNCKKVKDLTTGKEYGSITETAIIIGVTAQAVSNAIKNEGWCKGHRLMLLKELHDNIDVICDESAKANARADRAEAREKALLEEMAEFRKWKAEKEAEERRLEEERKAKEAHDKAIAKAQEKVSKYEAMRERKAEQLKSVEDKLMQAEIELEALLDGKEVA